MYSERSRNGSMNVITLSQRLSIGIFNYCFNKALPFISFVSGSLLVFICS